MPVICFSSCEIFEGGETVKDIPERRPILRFIKKPVYGDSGDIANQDCVIRTWLETGEFPPPNTPVRCRNSMANISWKRADPSDTPYPALNSI